VGFVLAHAPCEQKFEQHWEPVEHVVPSAWQPTTPPQTWLAHVPLQHCDEERHGTPSTWQGPPLLDPLALPPLLPLALPLLLPLALPPLLPLLPPLELPLLPLLPLLVLLVLPPSSPPIVATAPPQPGASNEDPVMQSENASEARTRRMGSLRVEV
jgi:hypothetical protein